MGDLGDGTGSSYPAALDTDTNQEVNSPSASKTKARAEVPNDLAAAVIAVQAELGTDPKGDPSIADVKTFLQTEHTTVGTHSETAASTIVETAAYLNYNAGLFSRPIFTYNGGASTGTIKVGSGQYWVKDKFAWWDAELTTTQAAGGTPTAATWYFLYLDYSAITSGTEITNAELIWSTDVPAYLHASRAWLRTTTNTDDRCIMACRGTGADFLEFFHVQDFIAYADEITDRLAVLSNSWVDVTLTAPSIATKCAILIDSQFSDATAWGFYRTNGQTGTTGKRVAYCAVAVPKTLTRSDVVTDASQIIEVQYSAAGTNVLNIYTYGWYFGVGI